MDLKNALAPLVMSGLLALALPLGLGAQEAGSISGSVLLDKQMGLAKAVVVYNKVIKLGRDSKGSTVELEPHISGTVLTDPDGSFLVKSVSPGKYSLCALPVEPNQIKSCDLPNPPVVVQAATAVASVVLNVTTGVLLSIVIDDPKGQINPKTLAVGWVSSGGAYSPATLAVPSPPTATYTVAIPKASTGNLFLDGSLIILDASGFTVPMRARSTAVVTSLETTALTISLRVQ